MAPQSILRPDPIHKPRTSLMKKRLSPLEKRPITLPKILMLTFLLLEKGNLWPFAKVNMHWAKGNT